MTLLEANEITVRFGGVTALNEVTVSAQAGEVTGLIGPNGAGKTTLFDVLTGIRKPDHGKVSLDGEEITGVPTHLRARRGVARTFQRLESFGSLTVRENVQVACDAAKYRARPKGIISRASRSNGGDPDALIDRVGLRGYADRQADAVPTGVARLVELARALAIDPRLLLLDEPSSGLSATETKSFAEVLRQLGDEGRAVLIVEHDMELIMGVCDRIFVLDFGQVIAVGDPARVRADPVVRRAYLGGDG